MSIASWAVVVTFVVPLTAVAQTKTFTWVQQARPGVINLSPYLDKKTGKVFKTQAKELIREHVSRIEVSDESGRPRRAAGTDVDHALSRTILIHTLLWKAPSQSRTETSAKSTVEVEIDQEHWYVYRPGELSDADFATAKRLLGVKNVGLLYVHLNSPKRLLYEATFNIQSKKKLPLPWQHLQAVLSLFGVRTDAAAGPAGADDYKWNFAVIGNAEDPLYVPSDVTISAEYRVVSWKNENGDDLATQNQSLDTSNEVTFDNEGVYRFDFSIGVPLKKVTEIKYVQGDNSLQPVKIDQQNIMAFLNLYLKPVDLKNQIGTGLMPHPVIGVKVGSQPLKQALVGVGIGPPLANIYAGVLLNTRAVAPGSTCSDLAKALPGAKLENKTCPEFSIGLNISPGAIAKALKK